MSAIRQFSRREPLLAIRVVGAIVALGCWAATRYLGLSLDTDEVLILVLGALGTDTLASHESVYSPESVDRLTGQAYDLGQRDVLPISHTETDIG